MTKTREFLVANLFDGDDSGMLTIKTSVFVDEIASVVDDYLQFNDEELATIKWLAGLVKAQALSERNSASALYGAYNDRGFVHANLQQARDKIARCEVILAKLEDME